MVRNDGVDARKGRIQQVIQMVVAMFNNDKDAQDFPLDVTLADIQYEIGLTEPRTMEYLMIGERRGLFVIDVQNNKIKKPS